MIFLLFLLIVTMKGGKKRGRMNIRNIFLFSLIAILAIFTLTTVMAVGPYGANVTQTRTETAPIDNATSNNALAGNVTELLISGYTTTQSWQGYFGNVSGVVQLADANDKVMYNWSVISPEGEVYASTNGTGIMWLNIQCFNFTAFGNYTSEVGSGGNTSLYGTNLSQLEARFTIAWDDVDGVNETFTLFGSGHDLFYTANQRFDVGECRNTRIYGDTGAGVNDEFEEVLLYEPVSTSVIFASILDEEGPLGFDVGNHDFEMLVLEDGHGTDISVTPYFFYIELE